MKILYDKLLIGSLVLAMLIICGSYFGAHYVYRDLPDESSEDIRALLQSLDDDNTSYATEQSFDERTNWHEQERLFLSENEDLHKFVEDSDQMTSDNFAEDFERSSEEAKREFYNSIGLEPPPPGHTYLWEGDGNARLVRYNESSIEVDWTQQNYGNFFQLSDEEFERYNALAAITDEITARSLRIPTNVVELAREWKNALYQKTWGSKPTIHAATVYNRPITLADNEEKSRLLERKYLDALPPPRRFSVNYDGVNQLIIELTFALGQDSQGILTVYE